MVFVECDTLELTYDDEDLVNDCFCSDFCCKTIKETRYGIS